VNVADYRRECDDRDALPLTTSPHRAPGDVTQHLHSNTGNNNHIITTMITVTTAAVLRKKLIHRFNKWRAAFERGLEKK